MPSRTWKSRCCRAVCWLRDERFLGDELCGGVQRDGDRFQRSLQIGDRHPEFLGLFIAQGGRQFRARQRRVGRQFDRGRVVLQRGVCLEKPVDPDRQRKSRAIEHVLLETFRAVVDSTRLAESSSSARRISSIRIGFLDSSPSPLSSSNGHQPISRATISSRCGSSMYSRAAPCISPSSDPAAGETVPTRIHPKRGLSRARPYCHIGQLGSRAKIFARDWRLRI